MPTICWISHICLLFGRILWKGPGDVRSVHLCEFVVYFFVVWWIFVCWTARSIFRIPVGQRWRWRWRWRWWWKLSHWKMLRKWNDIVPTYIEATKNSLGNISNEQVFTVDPYFGGTRNLGQPEKHFFDTFFQFWPWRGPKCDQYIYTGLNGQKLV